MVQANPNAEVVKVVLTLKVLDYLRKWHEKSRDLQAPW